MLLLPSQFLSREAPKRGGSLHKCGDVNIPCMRDTVPLVLFIPGIIMLPMGDLNLLHLSFSFDVSNTDGFVLDTIILCVTISLFFSLCVFVFILPTTAGQALACETIPLLSMKRQKQCLHLK